MVFPNALITKLFFVFCQENIPETLKSIVYMGSRVVKNYDFLHVYYHITIYILGKKMSLGVRLVCGFGKLTWF
jgi:hypothetical protein